MSHPWIQKLPKYRHPRFVDKFPLVKSSQIDKLHLLQGMSSPQVEKNTTIGICHPKQAGRCLLPEGWSFDLHLAEKQSTVRTSWTFKRKLQFLVCLIFSCYVDLVCCLLCRYVLFVSSLLLKLVIFGKQSYRVRAEPHMTGRWVDFRSNHVRLHEVTAKHLKYGVKCHHRSCYLLSTQMNLSYDNFDTPLELPS